MLINELSDIAKHLIEIMSPRSYVTCADIYAALPDADQTATKRELDQLLKARIILQGVTSSQPQQTAFWLENRPRPASISDRTVTTMADAGGISPAHYVFTTGDADYLKPQCGNRRFLARTASAPELLSRAATHMTDRAATYDKPEGERSMGTTVLAFNAITGRSITEAEGWLLLQLLKDVRLFQRPGYHADSAEDCIAYSALKAEAKAREQGAANE